MHHHVSFDSVHVYEFTLVVGDNPSCRQGLPIELSWECIRNTIVGVDTHEQFRQDKHKRRRHDDDRSCTRSKNNVCLQKLRPLSIMKRTRLLQEHGAIPKTTTAPRRISSDPTIRTKPNNRWQNAVEIGSYKSFIKAKQERYYDDDNNSYAWSVVVDGAACCDATTTGRSSSSIRDINNNMNDDACNHRAQLVLQRMILINNNNNSNNINKKNIEIEKQQQPSTTEERVGVLWHQAIQGMIIPPCY